MPNIWYAGWPAPRAWCTINGHPTKTSRRRAPWARRWSGRNADARRGLEVAQGRHHEYGGIANGAAVAPDASLVRRWYQDPLALALVTPGLNGVEEKRVLKVLHASSVACRDDNAVEARPSVAAATGRVTMVTACLASTVG